MAEDLLFIESDENLRAALTVYLKRQQFNVRTVDSGRSALTCIEARTPEIVLADPALPDRDGTAMLKKLKRENPDIPLILMAAPHRLEGVMEAFGIEADDYLEKPVKNIAIDIALSRARRQLAAGRKMSQYIKCGENLNYAHSRYQQLFNEVPCYISVQDRQFRITDANRLFKRDFGDEIGEFCYRVYKHRQSPCPECPVAKTFEDGKRHQTEEVVTSRAGKQYNVLTWTAPIRNENGDITQVMEMATNITQIRRLQDHLTSLGLMLGSMSHGVKGMLTALDGGVYQLETGIDKQDPMRIARSYDRIAQTAGRIRKMVLEILYYAKSRGMQYERADAHQFIRSIADSVSPLAEKDAIAFTYEIPPDLGMFEVDPVWLQQAFVNFLENAVDACTMDTDKSSHQVSLAAHCKDPENLWFEISDNGIGMDADARRKMFTLFFSSKGSKGTGLGLFIAHHVIQQHGGDIEVSSEYRKGTRVVIRVPRHRRIGSRKSDSMIHADVGFF